MSFKFIFINLIIWSINQQSTITNAANIEKDFRIRKDSFISQQQPERDSAQSKD